MPSSKNRKIYFNFKPPVSEVSSSSSGAVWNRIFQLLFCDVHWVQSEMQPKRDVRFYGDGSAMATREMRRLEQCGYIIREKRPGNAKTYEISLSDSGQRLYRELKNKLMEWWGELLEECAIDPEPFSEQLRIMAKAAYQKAGGTESEGKRTEKMR